ncbi:MAG: hypothetical protein Q9162_005594 [Coniocarpon cinnabarinum]
MCGACEIAVKLPGKWHLGSSEDAQGAQVKVFTPDDDSRKSSGTKDAQGPKAAKRDAATRAPTKWVARVHEWLFGTSKRIAGATSAAPRHPERRQMDATGVVMENGNIVVAQSSGVVWCGGVEQKQGGKKRTERA